MGSSSRSVAALVSLQFSNANHGPIPDAAIELPQTEVKKTGTQINRPVGPFGEAPDSKHDPIVFRTDQVGALG